MELIEIRVRGMHGFIDATVKLQNDIAIVVGVNGAGKTSLLNLTAHALRLNLPELLSANFERLSLKGRAGGSSFEILAAKSVETLTLKLKRKNRVVEEIVLPIPRWEEHFYQERSSRYAYDRAFRRVYEEIGGTKLAAFVQEFTRLTLVRLDRTLFAEDKEGVIAIEAPSPKRPRGDFEDPAARVEAVVKQRYNDYRIQARQHHEELTTQIVSLLFQVPSGFMVGRVTGGSAFTRPQLEVLRDKLTKVLGGAGSALKKKIQDYFDFATKAQERNASDGQQLVVARMLFRSLEYPRLNGLSAAFEKYERDVASSFAQLKALREQINDFLKDSGKEIFYSEAEASLRFRLEGEGDPAGRPITELSSGEKQIVIMLTYLAFLAGRHSVFIVDEPELSLHLAWQRKLITSLSLLRPASSQLILATHSPEIVGPYRSNVSRLRPSYKVSKDASNQNA